MTIYLNQRSKSRSRILGKIMYARKEGGDWYDANLRDCTGEGLSFFSNFPYLPGTEILVKSKNKFDNNLMAARVKWSRQKRDVGKKFKSYNVGAQFV